MMAIITDFQIKGSPGTSEIEIGSYDTTLKWDEFPYILMQSTGLKDLNGVEIFEGDIVKVTVNNYGTGERFEQIDKVVYEDCRFCFNDGFYYSETIKYSGYENKEVIGNVYENPELLEGTE
ncbi:hypothetical protein HRE06_14385, partial [Enterococcus faecalis]|nr:hypothetical protein [Enterococcus faecalis]NSN92278.1 hypothetical protein [Enterococcus faecalis]